MNVKLFIFAALFFSSFVAFCQKKKDEKATEPSKNPIETKINGLKNFPGFVEFYYDEKQDKVWLLIKEFGKELLYVNSLPAGIGSNDIGLDRGQLGGERIVKFDRRGPKILLVEPN